MMLLVVPCQVLGRVDTLRKRITSVGKQHASVCAKVNVYQFIYIDLHLQLMGMHTGLLHTEIRCTIMFLTSKKIKFDSHVQESRYFLRNSLVCAYLKLMSHDP
jgi:hypothetical protein